MDKLYGIRGQITHGERLLAYDQPRDSSALSQGATVDRRAGENATFLCRAALLNWLSNHDASSGSLLNQSLLEEKAAPPGTKSGVTVIIPAAPPSDAD